MMPSFRSGEINLFPGVLLVVMVLLAGPSTSFGDIYRCISDTGVVRFSDEPCGDNAEVAFKKYEMNVDDAAARDIIKPTTRRKWLSRVESDMKAHARHVGQAIVPRHRLNNVMIQKAGNPSRNEVLDWNYTLAFGPEENIREWVVELFYRGKMEKEASVWLRKVLVRKDRRPFDPPTMMNLTSFQKVRPGEWAYRKNAGGEGDK